MLWNIKYCLWFAWCSWRERTRCVWGLHQACLGPSRLRGVVRGGWIFSDGDIGQKLDSLQIQTPNCDGSKPAWRNRMQEVLTEANPQLLLLHPPFLGTVRAQNTRGWRRKLSRGSRLGWGVFCDVEEMLAFRKRGRKKKRAKHWEPLYVGALVALLACRMLLRPACFSAGRGICSWSVCFAAFVWRGGVWHGLRPCGYWII